MNPELPPQQTNDESFLLHKWYADCISDTGDTLIAYHGLARWKKLTICYSSLLTLIGDAPVSTQYSIKRDEEPSCEGSVVRWHSQDLGLEGMWTAIDPAYSETLFSSRAGVVNWRCLQPRASVEIRWGNGRTLSGLGYVERLEMSIPPWKLPVDELLWGRFVSRSDSLVWIDWRGPVHKRLFLHNGLRIESGNVEEHMISFGTAASLTFGQSALLRKGELGTVALAALSMIKKLLPRRILDVEETKWRSRATFTYAEPHEGWAIHEVVKWPR